MTKLIIKRKEDPENTIVIDSEANDDWMKTLPGYQDEVAIHEELGKKLSARKKSKTTVTIHKGGEGSGDFGHAGRPGEQGGSAPGKGYTTSQSDYDRWSSKPEGTVVWSDGKKSVKTTTQTNHLAKDPRTAPKILAFYASDGKSYLGTFTSIKGALNVGLGFSPEEAKRIAEEVNA